MTEYRSKTLFILRNWENSRKNHDCTSLELSVWGAILKVRDLPGAAIALTTLSSFTTSRFHSFLAVPRAAVPPVASGSHSSGAPSSTSPLPNPKPCSTVRAGIGARRWPRSVPRSFASRMLETTRCTCCVMTCVGGRSFPRYSFEISS